ncbi:unnamed protein product, partial [Prorocentrum cordatum]
APRGQLKWKETMHEKAFKSMESATVALSSAEGARSHVEFEMPVASSRKEALSLVLANNADPETASTRLRDYTAAVEARESARDVEVRTGGTTAADSVTGERAKLGQGPPRGSYEDLITMKQFDDKLETFVGASARQELTDIAEDLQKLKEAISELVGVTAGVARELSAGVVVAKKKIQQEKELTDQKKQKTEQSRRAARPAGAPPAFKADSNNPSGPFVFLPMSGVKEIEALTSSAFTKKLNNGLAFDVPRIVNIDPGCEVFEIFEGFLGPVLSQAMATAKSEMTSGLAMDRPSVNLAPLLQQAFFARAMGRLHCAPERGYLGAARASVIGSWEILAAPLTALHEGLIAWSAKTPLRISQARRYFKQMSEELFKVMVSSPNGGVYHGAVGARDMSIILPSWVALERASSAGALGLRLSWASRADVHGLDALRTVLTQNGSHSDATAEVLDYAKVYDDKVK